MYKLNFLYIELPKKIRLVSNSMGLNHCFNPEDLFYCWDTNQEAEICYANGVGIDDLFKLVNTGLFEHIYVLLTEENDAYYYDSHNKKINIDGWIDLTQFEKGKNI